MNEKYRTLCLIGIILRVSMPNGEGHQDGDKDCFLHDKSIVEMGAMWFDERIDTPKIGAQIHFSFQL